ncbi:dihydrouridine synthase [Bifidobacterium lemurum]|uniref:Dihydrouridine synthase n=1 Tax=Bifidobacterium lemurum TaxID=1603886 RepID=A0A261FNV8_9BIFI|nr:DivIVA domain-containing protein [Bifidobacterium lemurum]OZG60506.1 dihydrouridine synthase [Bifidobacterium lemurum]QOL34475.1 DivIVA domain-containing protein [Bifidobacterium lemurum]
MAQELQSGASAAGIARSGKRKWGYDPGQVDAFLERAHALYDSEGARLTQRDIQNVSFDLVKNGYVIAQVDAALARLERAVVDKQTTWEISQHGRIAWKADTENLYRQIINHVDRAAGERFKPGEPKSPSYDKKQVDRLADQIVDKAAAALGIDGVSEDDVRSLADLNATSVSNVIFTQRTGKRGYDERQVDHFLNSCVQLLSRIESYARVADYISADSGAATSVAPMPAPVAATTGEAVAPLFSSDAQYRRDAASSTESLPSFAPAATQHDESFDALHQAERSLFSGAPVVDAPSFAPVAAPAAPAAPVTSEASAAPEAQATPEVSAMPESSAAPESSVQDAPSFAPAPAPAATPEPAPAAVPAPAPVAVEQSPQEPVAEQAPQPDSSLAALAQMAETVQEHPVADTPSFEPHIPDLDAPVAAKADEDMPPSFQPASAEESSFVATTPVKPQDDSDGNLFPEMFPNVRLAVDDQIPDLSFPSLDDVNPAGTKRQQ